jgi:hypothetical protein
MSWDGEREKRKGVLRKAEFGVNLAEKELEEWRRQRKEEGREIGKEKFRGDEDPGREKYESKAVQRNITPVIVTDRKKSISSEASNKRFSQHSPITDISSISPDDIKIEKKVKDLEELMQIEEKNHRCEIERLESMIKYMRENRKIDPKIEGLQKAYSETVNELAKKCHELESLKAQQITKPNTKRLEIRHNSHSGLHKDKKSYDIKPVKQKLKALPSKEIEDKSIYWKDKAISLSLKYKSLLKSMKSELSSLKSDFRSESSKLFEAYSSLLSLIKPRSSFTN